MDESQQFKWNEIWSRKGFSKKFVDLGRNFYNLFFLSLLLRHANKKTEMVELGCGTATIALLLADKIKHYTGIDYSQQATILAKQNLINNSVSNASIITEDALKLKPALRQSFDLVWSHGLIEHFPEYKNVIKSHWDLARPGGVILISVPYKYSYHFIWHSLTKNQSLKKFFPWEDTDQKFLKRQELLGLGKEFSPIAEVSFLKPAPLGFLLGIIILKIAK